MRLFLESPLESRSFPLSTPEEIFFRMYPRLKTLDHEQCWALFLTKGHLLLGEECLTSGARFRTDLDVPLLIRRALEKRAAYVVLVHNHPSGDPHPSAADIEMTRRVQRAFKLMDLDLLDHLVIADGCFYSFDADRRFDMLPQAPQSEENLTNSKQLVTFEIAN